jgi:hypothetical protein
VNDDDLAIFVTYVDEGWKPPLTDVQKTVWGKLAKDYDPKLTFPLVLKMITGERFRPSLPDFKNAYKRALIDSTPSFTAPQARDEMPDWVRGWLRACSEGDRRLWPEMELGFNACHDEWERECGWDYHQRQKFGLKSGYEWTELIEKRGVMPQADRLDWITLAKSSSEEKALEEIMAGSPPA